MRDSDEEGRAGVDETLDNVVAEYNLKMAQRQMRKLGRTAPVKRVLAPPSWWGTADEIDAGNFAAAQMLSQGA